MCNGGTGSVLATYLPLHSGAAYLEQSSIVVNLTPESNLRYPRSFRRISEYEAAIKDYSLAMQMSEDKLSLFNHRRAGGRWCERGGYNQGPQRHNGCTLMLGMLTLAWPGCRAYCYAKIGCYAESVNDYNHVLELEPGNAHAVYNRQVGLFVQRRKTAPS